jgi:hypothetical protein
MCLIPLWAKMLDQNLPLHKCTALLTKSTRDKTDKAHLFSPFKWWTWNFSSIYEDAQVIGGMLSLKHTKNTFLHLCVPESVNIYCTCKVICWFLIIHLSDLLKRKRAHFFFTFLKGITWVGEAKKTISTLN